MNQLKNLLVLAPFSEELQARLSSRLPGVNIRFSTPADCTEEMISGAQVILGNPPVPLLHAAGKLEWLHLYTAGSEPYFTRLPESVLLSNSTGVYNESVAQYMLAMTLTLGRKLDLYHDQQQRRKWQIHPGAWTVEGRTVLVIGMGAIGSRFAEMLKFLGAHVIGVRSKEGPCPACCDEVHTQAEVDSLLPRADVVAMVLPGTPQTNGFMNEKRLRLMKPQAVLINAGRGNSIVESDLIRALNDGVIAGAALDVACHEPLPADDPLWGARNILITPHVSGTFFTLGNIDKVLSVFLKNLEAWQKGETLPNLVDRTTGYRVTTR